MAITPTSASQPILKNEIPDFVVNPNSDNTIINLLTNFDDPSTTGQAVRFEFHQPDLLADGIVDVILFDQADTGAPLTVQNFLDYVNNNDYIDNIIHRVIGSFVVQGGIYSVTTSLNDINEVQTNPPVQNEYSDQRPNILGTIAMAKLSGQPDSATSSWFFNMDDNSFVLSPDSPDNSGSGGFTTFGQVINDSSLAVAQAIANVETYIVNIDDTSLGNLQFDNFPLFTEPANVDSVDDLVRLVNITSFQLPELTFSVVNNSNPNLVNVSFDGQEIILDYQDNVTGSAEITVQATNIFGQVSQDTFSVNIIDDTNPFNPLDLLDVQLFRFQNSDRPGTYLFVNEEESQSVQQNFPNFVLEGEAFKVSSQPASFQSPDESTDELVRFNRFQNSNVPGTYLYATEGESVSIRQNFPQFEEEGIAFYAFSADANIGVDYYRMQNTQVPGTYIFVNEEERNQILTSFPQFVDEGIAFEVAL